MKFRGKWGGVLKQALRYLILGSKNLVQVLIDFGETGFCPRLSGNMTPPHSFALTAF